jgi:hypothetical protein
MGKKKGNKDQYRKKRKNIWDDGKRNNRRKQNKTNKKDKTIKIKSQSIFLAEKKEDGAPLFLIPRHVILLGGWWGTLQV